LSLRTAANRCEAILKSRAFDGLPRDYAPRNDRLSDLFIGFFLPDRSYHHSTSNGWHTGQKYIFPPKN